MTTNILVIDDDEAINYFYNRTLKSAEKINTVMIFEHAQEALDYLQSPDAKPIGVILLDISMPKMDGFEFADALKAQSPPAAKNSTILMLTASINPRDEERANAHPLITKLLSKPQSRAAMQTIIDTYCGQ